MICAARDKYLKYFWRMTKGGDLIGPTFNNFKNSKEAKEEIKEIMGINKFPNGFELRTEADYGCKVAKKEEKEAQEKSCKIIVEALNGLPCFGELNYISPKIGNCIYVKHSYQTVILSESWRRSDIKKGYDLGDPKQKEKFRKEIKRRLDGRIERQRKNKSIKGRTTEIGSFKHTTEKTIENAKFAIYLDNQNMVESDVHVVGSVKFHKRAPRQAMFDIDERKILTRDGEKEIEADNTDQVIDALINCLANVEK